MQKVFALLALAFTHSLSTHAQYCIENRFTQADYFSDDEIIQQDNVLYGLADDWYNGVPQPVLNAFNIAYPDPALDDLEKRPLVVLAHGGGFWGGDKEDLDYHIRELAKSGYVAVTMNYRKGWDGNPEDCLGEPMSLASAIYKAMQDVRACLRYLSYNAEAYGIDTSWIVLGGESAGAYAVMNSHYLSQNDWNADHTGIEEIFGGLDESTNELDVKYSIKAFVNMWGGIMDLDYVTPDELRPTVSFYGTSDDVIPPGAGHIQFCDNFERVTGSVGISDYMNENDVCNVLHGHYMYGHEAYESDYTAGNMACFLKSLFCEECTFREVEFEEADCNDIVLAIDDPVTGTLEAYPNPATNYVSVVTPVNMGADATITITDITGKTVQPVSVISSNTVTLNVSGLSGGIYLVVIDNGSERLTGKVIVSR